MDSTLNVAFLAVKNAGPSGITANALASRMHISTRLAVSCLRGMYGLGLVEPVPHDGGEIRMRVIHGDDQADDGGEGEGV